MKQAGWWLLKKQGETDPEKVGGVAEMIDLSKFNFGRPDPERMEEFDRKVKAAFQAQREGKSGYESGPLFQSGDGRLAQSAYDVSLDLRWATGNADPNVRIAQLRVTPKSGGAPLATLDITTSTEGRGKGMTHPKNYLIAPGVLYAFAPDDAFRKISLRFNNPQRQEVKLVLHCDGIGLVEVGESSITAVSSPSPTPEPRPSTPEVIVKPTEPATPTTPPAMPRVANTVAFNQKKLVFRYDGLLHPVIVPRDVKNLRVKLWGAGGGQNGGSGAFVSGSLPVVPGETLYLIIGQGGRIARNGKTQVASPGGGTGQGDDVWPGGGGGGLTAILRDNIPLVVVGAGGGGQFHGGGGGGTVAGGPGGGEGGGEGGTQKRPGRSGGPGGGTAGGAPYGGNGGQVSGGGGSGFQGGAGGGNVRSNGGGGGGSSLYFKLQSANLSDGRNGASGHTQRPTLPGGARDRDYKPGVGVGGADGKTGGPGLIVIERE